MADPHDELARLLDHAREDAPSEQLLSGVRMRVLSATSVPAAPIESMTVPRAVAPASSGAAGWLIKLGLGAVMLGVIAASYLALRPAPVPTAPAAVPNSAPAPEPPAIAPAAPVLVPAPVESPAPEPPVLEQPKRKLRRAVRPPDPQQEKLVPGPAPPVAATPAQPGSSFAEEVALLKLALDAQRAGRIAEARAKLDEHARRFPQGQLVSERKRIEARLPP